MNIFFNLKILIFVINIWCLSTNKLMEKCLSSVVNWVNKFLSQKIWSLWFFSILQNQNLWRKIRISRIQSLWSRKTLSTVKGFHKISTSIRLYFKFLKPVLSGICHIQSITIIKEYVFWRIIFSGMHHRLTFLWESYGHDIL